MPALSTIKPLIIKAYIRDSIIRGIAIKKMTHFIKISDALENFIPDLSAQALPDHIDPTDISACLTSIQDSGVSHISFSKTELLDAYKECCQEFFGQDEIPTRTQSFFNDLLTASFLLTDNLAYDLSLVPSGQDLRVFCPRDGKQITIPKATVTRWKNALLGTARCRADRLKWQIDIDMI